MHILSQVYEGRTPKIYICDPEIIKQIWIKESHKFPDRSFIDSLDFVLEFMDFVTGKPAVKASRHFSEPFMISSCLILQVRNGKPCGPHSLPYSHHQN